MWAGRVRDTHPSTFQESRQLLIASILENTAAMAMPDCEKQATNVEAGNKDRN